MNFDIQRYNWMNPINDQKKVYLLGGMFVCLYISFGHLPILKRSAFLKVHFRKK